MTQQCPLKPQARFGLQSAVRLRTKRVWIAISAFALLGAWLGKHYVALAQEIPTLDAASQGPAVMAHLNSVIQFYRNVSQPIQKAGEPNDVVYRDQTITQASQIAEFAFQSAKAQASLMAAYRTATGSPTASGPTEQQRLQTAETNAEARITGLQARETAIERQLLSAKPREVAALLSQRKQVQAALELAVAMKDALQRIVSISAMTVHTGLASDVERLQRSVPELQSKNKTSIPPLTTVQSALSAGLTSQGGVLFQLVESMHTLTTLIQENDRLHQQAIELRAPVLNILRSLVRQGQNFSQQEEAATPPAPKHGTKHPPANTVAPALPAATDLQSITAHFRAASAASVPLSQEIIVLEQSRANLVAWRSSVDSEYDSILHAILLRILVIAIALGLIIGGGEVWTRATNKYIRDVRRRRQLLIIRRVVVGFLSAIVILFGFVTQFNSLATFAGFITAGIAVGLQTILLSVAAYFFIIGRYGIKVGDRITIASVTGDVIDVGLVRFYLMELAGSGAALNPTGRVAVFSNAVLFQAGTPLYKQVPGTGYAWHELTVKLTDGADYKTICDAIVREIDTVYAGYRAKIEHQHESMKHWMQTSIDSPAIESRLQFTGGVFQLWVRFPVQIPLAAQTDEKMTHALLELMETHPEIKSGVAGLPSIQPSVRG